MSSFGGEPRLLFALDLAFSDLTPKIYLKSAFGHLRYE